MRARGFLARGEIAMRLLSLLMPQERKFFVLFNEHASLVVKGAAVLVEMLSDYTDNGRRDGSPSSP